MTEETKQYWERKIATFLHDPVDKVLKIPGHEGRAGRITETIGLSFAEFSKKADRVASGLDRAALPGYNKDDNKNGAMDYTKHPVLTHPVSKGLKLEIDKNLPDAGKATEVIVEQIKKDTGNAFDSWDRYKYFSYVFFALRKLLVNNDLKSGTGAGEKLGYLWQHLPADSRIPDHSIWNHLQMTSALQSCFEESEKEEAALVVFAISPVQPFITKTRKLRDHWIASVILSWLAYKGITSVMENAGPDHVVYPSLQDQPFIENYLKSKFDGNVDESFSFKQVFDSYEENSGFKKDGSVAAFPNKFVFLAPAGKEEEYVESIKSEIEKSWKKLSNAVCGWIKDNSGSENIEVVEKIFKRQTEKYWSFNWAASGLIKKGDKDELKKLFRESRVQRMFETVEKFSVKYPDSDTSYEASHSTAQSLLAASKTKPGKIRNKETGTKCPVCGEFEILHDYDYTHPVKASEYNARSNEFWEKLSSRKSESELREKERLCAVCAVKRFAGDAVACEVYKSDFPVLGKVFNKYESFESTGKIAFHEFFKRNNLVQTEEEKNKLAQKLQDREEKQSEKDIIKKEIDAEAAKDFKETDKYYAILMMDGDRMGDLVNGENINARWRDVLHPRLVERLEKESFNLENKEMWKNILDKKRMLTPSIHIAISEALGYFSVYAVPEIIKENKGRLIYAGGDDVCAVLPLSNVLKAAEKIKNVYNSGYCGPDFNIIQNTGFDSPVLRMLGNGENISISAGILICHYKQPLRAALEEAHAILDNIAKKKTGRNAFALRLKKRSGQHRDFTAKWDDKGRFKIDDNEKQVLESFSDVLNTHKKENISTSLIYRLSSLEDGVLSIMKETEKQEKALDFIGYEIKHSGVYKDVKTNGKDEKKKKNERYKKIAGNLLNIMLKEDDGKWNYNSEAAEIAAYMSKGGA